MTGEISVAELLMARVEQERKKRDWTVEAWAKMFEMERSAYHRKRKNPGYEKMLQGIWNLCVQLNIPFESMFANLVEQNFEAPPATSADFGQQPKPKPREELAPLTLAAAKKIQEHDAVGKQAIVHVLDDPAKMTILFQLSEADPDKVQALAKLLPDFLSIPTDAVE